MKSFLSKFRSQVMGVLSGFDRLVFRGVLRGIMDARGMAGFLYGKHVLLKDFGPYAEQTTRDVVDKSLEAARRLGREVRYLESSRTRKEDVAREIAQRDGIHDGLICVLACVEPCLTFQVFRNRETQRLELRLRESKCKHLYHYFQHSRFGFMHARLQTWFPFGIQVCLNGREWLRRDLVERGVRFRRYDNSLTFVEDLPTAQHLLSMQLKAAWPALLDELLAEVHPLHRSLFPAGGPAMLDYYWSVHQSEWATDVMFRNRAALRSVYDRLIRFSIASHDSVDVLRFLGRRVNGDGSLRRDFTGEVVSDVKERPEGIRIKHRINQNSVKMYDKGSVLRFETTINNPRDFKVYRAKEGGAADDLDWRELRKGVADLARRAQISQSSNERYMEAMAAGAEHTTLRELIEPLCRRVTAPGRPRADGTRSRPRRHRPLNPHSREDQQLLRFISREEFVIGGFRNRDLRQVLFGTGSCPPRELRRRSASVTRKLALLKAHGLVRKLPRTHRYQVTERGRKALTAFLAASSASVDHLVTCAA